MYRIDDICMVAPACFLMLPSSFPAHLRMLRGGNPQRCRLIDGRHACIDSVRDRSVGYGISRIENTRDGGWQRGADR